MSEKELNQWLRQAAQGDAVACYNAGVILQAQHQLSKAIELYYKALEINPQLIQAYNNLGGIFKSKNQDDEALAFYQKALSINPQNPEINNNIGVILKERDFKKAIPFFNKAIFLDPLNAVAFYNLGLIYENQREWEKAISAYEKSYKLDSTALVSYWAKNLCQLQKDFFESENLNHAINILSNLQDWVNQNAVDPLSIVGHSLPFFLTYQEYNHLPILSLYGDICVDLMAKFQPTNIKTHNSKNKKIRIVFVGNVFHNHSIWIAILKGWYQHLDRECFEVVTCNLNLRSYLSDPEHQLAKQSSDLWLEGESDVLAWRDRLIELQADMIIYPAIGMDRPIYQLACLRLAPIQVACWGHPETAGLSTIDYYLSGEAFEPAHAAQHYREKLHMLPALGSYYEPLCLASEEFDWTAVGVSLEGNRLLICAGSCFKYSAKDDAIYPRIAQRCPDVKFVFFKGSPEMVADEFKARLIKQFAQHNLNFEKHCIFLPKLKKSIFHQLMKKAYLCLDSMRFSGFNTVMQALECNLPVVTLEGEFMRGRFGGGILRCLDLNRWIAHTVDEYIDATVALLSSESEYLSYKNRISDIASLYKNSKVIDDLENFLKDIKNNHPSS